MKLYYLSNSDSVRTVVCDVKRSLWLAKWFRQYFFKRVVKEGVFVGCDEPGMTRTWVPPHRILRIDL